VYPEIVAIKESIRTLAKLKSVHVTDLWVTANCLEAINRELLIYTGKPVILNKWDSGKLLQFAQAI
jgi:hypothetical protein